MISIYSLCLLAIAFSANGQQHYHDGPCKTPVVTFTWDQVADKIPQKPKWYSLYSNYELAKDPATAWKCYESIGENKEDGYHATTSYTDSDGHHSYETKYTAHPSKEGIFISFKKTADGEWEPFGWEFTYVAFEDKYVLEYGCKEHGDKHEDFFRVLGLDKNIPEEIGNIMKKHVKDNGDERDFVELSYENC